MAGFSSRRVLVAAGVLATAVGALLAVGVAAHTTGHNSSVRATIHTVGNFDHVYGLVTSGVNRCEPGRRVRLYMRQPGADARIGSDVSQQAALGGPYTVTAQTGEFAQGTYYAKLKKRDLRPGNRHRHLCKGDRSPDLLAGP